MRITILQGAFFPVPAIRGGAIEKAWEALGKAFAGKGHEVTHISRLCDGLLRKETRNGVVYKRVAGFDSVTNPYLLKFLEFFYVLRARRILKPAEVIVTHAFWAPLLLPKEKLGKIYVHVGRIPKGQLGYYRKASRFQVPTHAVAAIAKDQLKKRSKDITVLPYPLTSFPTQVPSVTSRPKRILYVGRIHPEKGLHTLIDAFCALERKEFEDWELRIVGPWEAKEGGGGPQFLRKLKEKAKEAKAINILNPIYDPIALQQEYLNARIFAYPSLSTGGETFGLSVLEAMSCGCIPLVSALPCFHDFTTSGINAYVVDSESTDFFSSFTLQLKYALSDSENWEKISAACLKEAHLYRIDKIADDYLKDFARCSQGRS